MFEPGLEDLIRGELEKGRLRFSSDPKDLAGVDIIWITYDTPVDENDQADVDSVIKRITKIFPYVGQGTLVLISSQLPVSSTRRLEEIYKSQTDKAGSAPMFAYSPENLRLGKAIEVFMRPDRVVVGARATTDRDRIALLLKPFTEKIEWMSVESAEMLKHALNAFLAMSIAFTNELATLCERVGADAQEVERGLKSDVRIGPRAYLRPGQAFAGGTLARDLSFLVDIGHTEGLPTHLFSAVQLSNEAHKVWPRRRLLETLGDLHAETIAILGLTYKPGTDTLRRSTAIETCRWLHEQGASIVAYDPVVRTLPNELAEFINLCSSVEKALYGATAAFVSTEWP
ncbi:MAG: nucleotide sugar dehydrogenase, partial [Nitrososphaera sp.]|nr:nucleotide sugar dehydrogenase [Nitrososphaera sp.]